jgi:hypothetical protein
MLRLADCLITSSKMAIAYCTLETVYLICFELPGDVETGGLFDNIFQDGRGCPRQICTQETGTRYLTPSAECTFASSGPPGSGSIII